MIGCSVICTMLPSILDITREECKGVLRRLELESYSNVVSTFRAQGILDDSKKKILEDLRCVFHISQDRHRAEARRVANDEKLCTIAEVMYGPNTTQEWNQEGRRTFPLLAKGFAYTAFSSVANSVARKLIIENSKIQPRSNIQQKEEPEEKKIVEKNESNIPIVKKDPITPNLNYKKKLKRLTSCIEKISNSFVPPPIPRKGRKTRNEDKKQSNEHNSVNANCKQIYHSNYKSRQKRPPIVRRKMPAVKETLPSEGAKSRQQHKHIGPIKNIVKTLSPDNKISLNVPNPQVLHTYANLSQKSAGQNFPRNMENVKPVTTHAANSTPQLSTQIKSSFPVVLSKKDVSANNVFELNLLEPKQNTFEEKKDDTIIVSNSSNQSSFSFISNDASSMPPCHVTNSQKTIVITEEKNSNKTDANKTILSEPLTVLSTPFDNINNYTNQSTQQLKPQTIVPTETRITSDIENSNTQQQKLSINQPSSPSVCTKRKIQITNSQIIHPIKISSVGLQPRKGIKIISSGNGQLFIQSTGNNSNKTINSSISSSNLVKVIPSQQNIVQSSPSLNTVSSGINCGNIITPTILSNRMGLQKIHILPKINKQQTTVPKAPINQIFTTNSPNTTSNVKITYDQGNVITSNVTTETTSNLKPIKHENSIVVPHKLFQSTPITNKSNIVQRLPQSSQINKNNVIVIGSILSNKKEDVVYQTSYNDNTNKNNNIITEDTPVYIVTAPVTNLGKSTTTDLNSISTVTTESSNCENFDYETKSQQIINNEIEEQIENEELDLDTKSEEMYQMDLGVSDNDNIDDIIISDDNEKQLQDKELKELMYEVTDWEVELDQEAIRSKEKSSLSQNINILDKNNDSLIRNQEENKMTTNTDDNIIYMTNNFNDVIEVDSIEPDDDDIIVETNLIYNSP